jgi:osmotically-inducible protein OsmY
MTTKLPRVALAAALAALALAACDRESMDKADRAGAEVGRKANEALAVTKEKLAQAGEKTREAVNGVAKPDESTGDTGKQTREALSDTAITASIKADLLKDPDLSVLKIDVDTKDGVVTLNGLAENDAARTRAGHIAEGIKGVREVRNYLVTKKA